MIDRIWPEEFATDWIAAWNAHDLNRIFADYVDDFEMRSPLIVERMGFLEGRFKGKDAIAIAYRHASRSVDVIERIEFNDQGLGVRAEALYGSAR